MPGAGREPVKISKTKGINNLGSDLIPQEAIQSKILPDELKEKIGF